MEFMFSRWQFEAFNFIKFKNEIILARFLMGASEWEVSGKGIIVYQISNAI